MGPSSSPSPAQQQKVRQLLREESNMFAPSGFPHSTSFSKLHLSSPACSASLPLCVTPRNSDSMYSSHLSELWLWRLLKNDAWTNSPVFLPPDHICSSIHWLPFNPHHHMAQVCVRLIENMQLSSALFPVLV